MTLSAVALTDIGKVRGRNEDSFLLDQDASLFVVADGMGGHAAGDVASQTAVAAFAAAFIKTHSLTAAMQSANQAVIERSTAEIGRAGMGTTLTAVHLNDGTVQVAHVGDSRLYRVRARVLEQLTRDHTIAQDMIDRGDLTPLDAMQHPANSMLTRSIGSQAQLQVDQLEDELRSGDLLMLCSDGLTSMVTDEDVSAILRQGKSLEQRAAELIEAANRRGGLDNVTVLLIECE